jgi:hypothetical protein
MGGSGLDGGVGGGSGGGRGGTVAVGAALRGGLLSGPKVRLPLLGVKIQKAEVSSWSGGGGGGLWQMIVVVWSEPTHQ